MKKLFLIIGFVGLSLVFTMASEAADIEAVTEDNTINSGFSVKEGTGSTTLMRVRGDGNVGIGDSTPDAELDVESTAPTIYLTDTTASAKSLAIDVNADIADLREIAGASGSLMTLDLGNNRVGIGTSSPQETFQVGEHAVSVGDVRVTADDVAGYWNAEANPMWELHRDMGGGGLPGIGLGPGGATAYDTKIYRSGSQTLQTSATGIYRDLATSSLNIGGGTTYNDGGGFKLICDTITGGSTTGVELYIMSGRTFEIMKNSGSWERTLKAWGGGGVRITDDTGASTDPGANNLAVDGTINTGEVTGTTTVTAPTTGNKIYSRLRAGRRLLNSIGPAGVEFPLQPAIFTNKIGWWSAGGTNTVVSTFNFGHSTTATVTTRTVTTVNLFTSMRRVAFVTSTASTSQGGTRHNLAQFWRGNAAGLGGFYYVARFGISQTQANMRWFVGLYGTTGVIGTGNPTTLLNIIGVGVDAGGTTVWFMTNDGSGAATTTDLLADFPATTTVSTDMYEFRLFCPPQGTVISYSLERLNTGNLAEGSVDSDLPVNTTLLSPQVWVSNGTGTGSVAIDVVSQYIETDN